MQVGFAILQDRVDDALPPDMEDMIERLHSLNSKYRDTLQSTALQYDVCHTAIEKLQSCWQRKIYVLEWLNDLDPAFLADLQEGNVFVKLIITFWALSMCTLDDVWWVSGMGRKIVMLAIGSIDTSDHEVHALLQTARSYAGV